MLLTEVTEQHDKICKQYRNDCSTTHLTAETVIFPP